MPQPEVIARRNLNGHMTEVLSTHAEAEANGWEITKVLRPAAEKPGPKPFHKKVEKPEAPEPASPPPAEEPAEEEQSYDDLYEQAQDLEIRGRSKMNRDQLAAAIAEATEEE